MSAWICIGGVAGGRCVQYCVLAQLWRLICVGWLCVSGMCRNKRGMSRGDEEAWSSRACCCLRLIMPFGQTGQTLFSGLPGHCPLCSTVSVATLQVTVQPEPSNFKVHDHLHHPPTYIFLLTCTQYAHSLGEHLKTLLSGRGSRLEFSPVNKRPNQLLSATCSAAAAAGKVSLQKVRPSQVQTADLIADLIQPLNLSD